MRSAAFKAALATMMLLGSGAPALAYYPDDHVWDKEYQSGVEWNYPVHKKPVPWISSVAWRERYPTAPTWWSSYAYGAWAPASYNYAAYYDPHWYNSTSSNITYNPVNGWYGKYPAVPTSYIPVNQDWTVYNANTTKAWDNVAWNVAWWDRNPYAVSNAGYYKGVFDSAQNPYSNTSLNRELQIAAAYGDLARVKALVGSGADIHARDWEGYTPLTWAAQHGRRDVVDYLLSRFSHTNTVDRWGYTPLMWAVQQGHTEIAAMLLAKGANPRVSTHFGVTPEVLATYSAGGRSRSLIADALNGRKPDYWAWYKAGSNANWGASAMGSQAQAMAPTPAQTQALTSSAGMATMDANTGLVKLSALAADYGIDSKNLAAEATSGGIGLNTLGALANNPDNELAPALGSMFANVLKDRDYRKARAELENARLKVKAGSRLAKYVTSVDETLRAMGY